MRFALEICFALALSLFVTQRAIDRSLAPLDLIASALTIIGIVLFFVFALINGMGMVA